MGSISATARIVGVPSPVVHFRATSGTTTVWDISSTSKNAFCKQETLIERNFLLAIEVGTEFR
jgi:hypothetical protein